MVITLQQAKKVIDELDLSHVIKRVMKEKRWTRRMTEVAAKFYKNFLFLCKKYPDYKLSPTQQIDEIWHAHILYTKEYQAACERIFGYYLHHEPTHDEKENSPKKEGEMERLQKLHQKEFKEPIYDAVYSLQDLIFFIQNKLQKH